MLVKNGFEGISHFINHPEMLPHVGGRILFVGECVNLPEKNFEDTAELFQNWYEEPTPQVLKGFSEQEWRMAKVYFDVRQTVHRNYDKYVSEPPQLLAEVSKMYHNIAEKIFAKYINYQHMYSCYGYDMQHMEIIYAMRSLEYDLEQDVRSRFLNCSYCTYFQRPNLTSGEFQEIMPDEDKKSFEIFLQILKVIEPRLVIVLSKKASESIKRFSDRKLPYKTLYFNSVFPNEWSDYELKKFKTEVGAIFKEKAKFHLKDWIMATGGVDEYFTTAIYETLIGNSFERCHRNLIDSFDKLIETNAADLIAKNPNDKKKSAWFNCYPLNIDTKKISPLFLAICRGDETLETVFEKMLEQAQKIITAYPEGNLVKRNIVLLTDKWDKKIFKRYKNEFFKYKPLINFVFGLVEESEIKSVGR